MPKEVIPPKRPDPMPVEWRQVRSMEELEAKLKQIAYQERWKKYAQAHPFTHQMIRSFGNRKD